MWPDAAGRTRGTLSFTLTLPPNAGPVTVRFGKAHYDVVPGRVTTVVYTIDAHGPWSLPFTADSGHYLDDLRSVSVQSTPPVLHRAGAPVARDSATA